MSNKVSHNEEGNMSLVGHLREVRNRIALVFVALIVVFFACFACIKPLANKLLEMGKNSATPWISPRRNDERKDINGILLSKLIINGIFLPKNYGLYSSFLGEYILYHTLRRIATLSLAGQKCHAGAGSTHVHKKALI